MESFQAAWEQTAGLLPEGWDLSLRCQSHGLGAEHRSDKWRAVAEHREGSVLEGRGDDPMAALADLRRVLS